MYDLVEGLRPVRDLACVVIWLIQAEQLLALYAWPKQLLLLPEVGMSYTQGGAKYIWKVAVCNKSCDRLA